MKSGLPRVTVVIPSGGRWELLRRAIQAVDLQQDVVAEAVVVVNGPAAADQSALAEVRNAGARVLTLEQPSVSLARNAGIAAAESPWVALLDDDDLWGPRKLASQVAGAERAGAAFAYCSAITVTEDFTVRRLQCAPDPAELVALAIENNPIPASVSNLLVETELARSIAFREDLRMFADWDFAARLVRSAPGARCPEVEVAYLLHANGMHLAHLEGVEAEFERMRSAHAREGHRIGSREHSRWLAGSFRESGQRRKAARTYLRGARRYRSPGDVVRAGASLLGERAIGTVVRRPAAPPAPEWLETYR